MNDYHNHSKHSLLVRNWKPSRHTGVDPFALDWQESEAHNLRSPHEGYLVRVSFSCYPKHSEYIRIRTTNWRAEYEQNGIFFKEDGRKFYKALIAAGFVKEIR